MPTLAAYRATRGESGEIEQELYQVATCIRQNVRDSPGFTALVPCPACKILNVPENYKY